ncbi:MAG: IS3 family transposase, partial [Acidobacteria bacterium]|nr:IS3 family transposase [Acidobacteriota bacterium]
MTARSSVACRPSGTSSRRDGYRRVGAALRQDGMVVNSKKVRRLMREHHQQPERRRRFVAATDSDLELPVFPNLASNIVAYTYVAVASGFCSAVLILDAWSRRVVGYAVAGSIDARRAVAALEAASASRRPPCGCICHTDRGSQYEPYRVFQRLNYVTPATMA